VELFIEANDGFFFDRYGIEEQYFLYDRARKRWQKHRETYCYISDGGGVWQCDEHGEPDIDFRPAVFFEVCHLCALLSETASPAEQRRLGSYSFLNSVVKMLELDPRCVMQPGELSKPPRPCREELERKRVEKLYGHRT
jgi:hypothetical protein